MSETTTLVCTDQGRPVAEASSANGSRTATFKDIKSAIKAEKAAKLGGISADKFTLCKVPGNVTNAAVDKIVPFENKNASNEVPKSTAEVSGLHDTGSRKAIHVVVERSPSERSVKPLEAFDLAPSAPTCALGRGFLNSCHKLYLSHLLTSWVDRSFEFASFLLISKVYTGSLLQASAYGLATTLADLLLSNRIGNWINILSRLNTYRITLLIQKASIVISTLFFHFLGNNKDIPNSTGQFVIFAFIVILGCALKLAFIGNSIAIEKDWAMIISDGNLEQLLPTMRRIDLVCKTVSPIFVGFLITADPLVITLVICCWTAASTLAEYILISQIHHDIPRLHDRAPYQSSSPIPTSSPSGEQEERGEEETSNNNTASAISFREYVQHKTFPITLSVGMLYINVLSFGGTMTSYLVLIGYSSGLLGIMKAVAGIVGVAGTFAQPLLTRKLGNMRAGLWSVWQLVLTLGLVVLALTDRLGNRTATSILLFGGMAATRLGLWIFDITESLILQEYTAAAHITSISGWQYTVCNLFDLLQYVLTIVVPDPSMFIIPACVSLGFIVAAAMIYSHFVWRDRGHLFHKLKLK
ncbi:hypothetical protein BGZ51_007535 [Haplosporangium sp. Z 767]|nr:hypothetical protein BGZ50_007748 [Haplosporangium sp. Z 11]KAF9178723.1 hypothetical protein BGZ51_007535 [Haplosporangium sp. Z 767]